MWARNAPQCEPVTFQVPVDSAALADAEANKLGPITDAALVVATPLRKLLRVIAIYIYSNPTLISGDLQHNLKSASVGTSRSVLHCLYLG